MSKHIASMVVVVVAIVASAAPVRAQLGMRDKRVLLLTAQGDDAFAVKDFDLALKRYEEAYKLAPRPELLQQMAVCEERRERPVEAIELYRRYLQARPGAGDAAAVKKSIIALSSKVALIKVETNVLGAAITIDRKPYGVTPIEPFLLKAGRYKVQARREGYETASEVITVSGGTAPEAVKLQLVEVKKAEVGISDPCGTPPPVAKTYEASPPSDPLVVQPKASPLPGGSQSDAPTRSRFWFAMKLVAIGLAVAAVTTVGILYETVPQVRGFFLGLVNRDDGVVTF